MGSDLQNLYARQVESGDLSIKHESRMIGVTSNVRGTMRGLGKAMQVKEDKSKGVIFGKVELEDGADVHESR